jgi:hypothetical protein
MRRWFMWLVLATAVLSNTGCLINAYSSDPNRRMDELMHTTFQSGVIGEDGAGTSDCPPQSNAQRIHGGIQ